MTTNKLLQAANCEMKVVCGKQWTELNASKTQLRTLQRRVKTWRTERAKEMVLGSLRKSAAMLAEI
jgi:hypothetical protein